MEGITIACHDDEVPAFVAKEMEDLYQNLFSSLIQFTVYGAAAQASTYVARKDGKIIAILLFRRHGARVEVINEAIGIDQAEILRFVDFVFGRFPSVQVVLFRAIQTCIDRLPFPHQQFNYLEDIVIPLPATPEQYLASLGKSTRRTIHTYLDKLKRQHPSFSYRVYTHEELNESQILDVIRLNWARMAGKNKASAYDEQETARIIALARACGLVGIATIDGRICAGSVGYRVGANHFIRVIAHDPAYDDYRLGTICCFLLFSDCIERGGKECHLLWGRHEYKYRFLGVRRDLDNVTVYRSHATMLRHADIALEGALLAGKRKIALRMQQAKRSDDFLWRWTEPVRKLLARLKRAGSMFPKREK